MKGPLSVPGPFAKVADELAEKLRAKGVDVERADYDPMPDGLRPLHRSYVIARLGDEKVDWQANEAYPIGTPIHGESPLRDLIRALAPRG